MAAMSISQSFGCWLSFVVCAAAVATALGEAVPSQQSPQVQSAWLDILDVQSDPVMQITVALRASQSEFALPLVLKLTRSVGLYAWSEKSWLLEADSALCQFSGPARQLVTGGPTRHNAFASLNLCRGPSGVIDNGGRRYLVEPASGSRQLNLSALSLVEFSLASLRGAFASGGRVRLTQMMMMSHHRPVSVGGCATHSPVKSSEPRGRFRRSTIPGNRSGFAESVNHRFVEILIAVDSSIVSFHRTILDDFVFGILGIAQGIFRDPQLEENIELSLASIYHLSPEEEAEIMSTGPEQVASDALDAFNAWAHRLHYAKFGKSLSWDISVLLTRKFLFSYVEYNNQFIKDPVLGITTYRSLCEQRRNGIVLQEIGLQSGFSLAHELGHAFNMYHDNSPVCTRKLYAHESKGNFVMDSSLHPNSYPWTWSVCSKMHMNQFLQ